MQGMTGPETARAAVDGAQRARLFADMRAYLDWAETHPAAPIPLAPVMNVRVPDGEDSDRAAYVRWFAAQHEVPAVEAGGLVRAVHRFGGVAVEAHAMTVEAQTERWHAVVRPELAA